MKKVVLIIVFLSLTMLVGCNAFEAFWAGLSGQEAIQNAQEITEEVEDIKNIAKETGELDINKVLSVLEKLMEANKNAPQKLPWYLNLIYIIGVAGGTYLGTRKLRKSKIGTLFNKVVGVFNKDEKKKG